VDADDVAEPLEKVDTILDRNVRRLALALLLVGFLVSMAVASNSPLLDILPDGMALPLLIPLVLAAIFALLYTLKLGWEACRSR
jgi:hypothetical protein